ncbi:MAG: hypothetical protein ABI577_13460 [bacterium]
MEKQGTRTTIDSVEAAIDAWKERALCGTAAAHDPTAALRRAITAAILENSPFPLLAAAELLLEECRNADEADPEWQAFLLRLSQAEVEAFLGAERRVADRGTLRRGGPPHLWAVS